MFKPKPTHLMDWEQDKINRFTALSKDYTPISGCITQVFWEKGWVIKVLYAMLKGPTAQIAHLVFADTQAVTEKPKELFFANA